MARGREVSVGARRTGIVVSSGVVLALLNALVVVPGGSDVFASDVFGALRLPGDAAFIAGHRGDRSAAPENTLPAFAAAFENPALQFVETDVQLSRDGVPMLFHDTTLRRVTGSPRRVGELSFSQLRRLDVGTFYHAQFAGTRMPSLEEFLVLARGSDKRLLVELKSDWTREQLATVMSVVEASGVGSRVIMQSFSIETMLNLQREAPAQPRLLLMRELPDDPVPMASRMGLIAIGTTLRSASAAPDAVRRLHEAGIGLVCYTLNTQQSWAEARALGVDGIITDTPVELGGWQLGSAG